MISLYIRLGSGNPGITSLTSDNDYNGGGTLTWPWPGSRGRSPGPAPAPMIAGSRATVSAPGGRAPQAWHQSPRAPGILILSSLLNCQFKPSSRDTPARGQTLIEICRPQSHCSPANTWSWCKKCLYKVKTLLMSLSLTTGRCVVTSASLWCLTHGMAVFIVCSCSTKSLSCQPNLLITSSPPHPL